MKHFVFVFLVVGSNCFEDNVAHESWSENRWNYEKELKIVGLKPNERELIYRPCHFDNLRCIRKFFADNSKCTVSRVPVPDPLIFRTDTVYLPYVNLTVVLDNVQTSGLNSAKIREFYINKDTRNVVLAVEFSGLSERSSYTMLRYKRTAREPIILTDYTTVTYGLVTLTAAIPNAPHLELDKADIHADIADSSPPYVVGPDAYNSTDPDVQKAFAEMTNSLPLALRESFVLKSTALLTAFIQNRICDFGLKFFSY